METQRSAVDLEGLRERGREIIEERREGFEEGDVADASLELLASLRLEGGERWGAVATAAQLADAHAVLAQDGPQRHWLGRARGYGKTTDAAALSLVAMLERLPRGARAYAGASDREQARLLRDAMAGFIHRTDETRGALELQAYRIAVPRRDVVLEALAADASSAFGLRPAWLVLDELCQWPETPSARGFYEALTTSLPKVPDATLVVITTAGRPGSWQARTYEHARAELDLCRVSDLRGPPPWMPENLVEAERRRLPESSFRRWFHNEWVEPEDALTTPTDLQAALRHAGPLDPVEGARYVIGLDLGLKRDRSVASVCHRDADGVIVLDRQRTWQGSRTEPVSLTEVEAWVELASGRYNGAEVVADFWQAAWLLQTLRRRRIRAREFSFTQQSASKLVTTLHVLLRDRRVALPSDAPDLLDELQSVHLRETAPNCFRIDHDSSRHDDRVISLGLAAYRVLELASWSRPRAIHGLRTRPGDPRRGPRSIRAGRFREVEALNRRQRHKGRA